MEVKRCCANCIYLDKDKRIDAQIGSHYIYECNKLTGLCIKDWVNNDAELENMVCDDFKILEIKDGDSRYSN